MTSPTIGAGDDRVGSVVDRARPAERAWLARRAVRAFLTDGRWSGGPS